MKNIFVCLSLLLITGAATAQLKATVVCPTFEVNLLEGNVSGLGPDFTQGQIAKKLPCYSSMLPDGDSSKCGGIIYYKDQDVTFYTGRDYVEVGEKFKGKLSLPIMGTARSSLFSILGNPKIKDVNWDAFQTQYGIMVIRYNKDNKVNMIQFSTKKAETLQLCD